MARKKRKYPILGLRLAGGTTAGSLSGGILGSSVGITALGGGICGSVPGAIVGAGVGLAIAAAPELLDVAGDVLSDTADWTKTAVKDVRKFLGI